MEKKIYAFSGGDWNDPVLLKLTKKQAKFINWFLQNTSLDYTYYLEEISNTDIAEFKEEED